MAITPEDLINKSFKVVNVGPSYSMNEVDDFLDELVGELRRLNAENNSLRRKLEDCESRKGGASTSETTAAAAAPAGGGSQDAAGLLAMAQKVHDDYVSQGERTKAELIAEAEKKANQLVVEAEIKRGTKRRGTGYGTYGTRASYCDAWRPPVFPNRLMAGEFMNWGCGRSVIFWSMF